MKRKTHFQDVSNDERVTRYHNAPCGKRKVQFFFIETRQKSRLEVKNELGRPHRIPFNTKRYAGEAAISSSSAAVCHWRHQRIRRAQFPLCGNVDYSVNHYTLVIHDVKAAAGGDGGTECQDETRHSMHSPNATYLQLAPGPYIYIYTFPPQQQPSHRRDAPKMREPT